jgi:hypothetical protein
MQRRCARLRLSTALLVVLVAPSVVVAQSTFSTVSGVVFDSLSRAPLTQADVQLVLERAPSDPVRSFFALSDDRGAFRIDSVPPGTYLLGFFHPRLDSLGILVTPRRVVIGSNPRVRADLGTPSPSRLIGSVCKGKEVTDTTSLLIGFVRDAATRAPRGAGSVTIRWGEIVIERNRISRLTPEVNVETTDAGWFGVCGVPARIELSMRAAQGSDTSGFISLELPGREVIHRDFYVGRAERVASARTDSLARDSAALALGSELRGPARLSGVVRNQNGRPVSGARVSIWGAVSQAVTDDNGAFALIDLPSGTRTIDVRALGYVPTRDPVDLLASDVPNHHDVRLISVKTVLDTMRITGTVAFNRDANGFDRRRRMGFGHFVDRETIERRPAIYTTDFLRMMPSVYVQPGSFGQAVFMRSTMGGYCRPELYIDGMRFPPDFGDIDQLTSPDQLAGIEVYTRALQAPAEYSSFQSGCGSVVIWTRKVAPRPKRVKEPKPN